MSSCGESHDATVTGCSRTGTRHERTAKYLANLGMAENYKGTPSTSGNPTSSASASSILAATLAKLSSITRTIPCMSTTTSLDVSSAETPSSSALTTTPSATSFTSNNDLCTKSSIRNCAFSDKGAPAPEVLTFQRRRQRRDAVLAALKVLRNTLLEAFDDDERKHNYLHKFYQKRVDLPNHPSSH